LVSLISHVASSLEEADNLVSLAGMIRRANRQNQLRDVQLQLELSKLSLQIGAQDACSSLETQVQLFSEEAGNNYRDNLENGEISLRKAFHKATKADSILKELNVVFKEREELCQGKFAPPSKSSNCL